MTNATVTPLNFPLVFLLLGSTIPAPSSSVVGGFFGVFCAARKITLTAFPFFAGVTSQITAFVPDVIGC